MVRSIYTKRMLIAGIAAAIVGITFLYLIQAPSLYRSTTQILLSPQQRQPFEDPANAVRLSGDPFFVDSQIAVILSASILRPVVIEQNLISDPEFGPNRAPGILGQFKAAVFGESSGARTLERQTVATLENLRSATSVSRQGSAYVLNVTVESEGPSKAAVLSQAISEAYVSESRQQSANQSENLAGDLDKQLKLLRERVREAEQKVQQFRAENKLQNVSGGALLVDNELEGLNNQLVEAQSALAVAEASYQETQRYLEQKISPSSLGDLAASQSINQLLDQYTNAVRTEASLANELLPSHPALSQARAQISRLEKLIRDELNALGQVKRVERDVAANRVKNLQAQINRTRANSNIDEELKITLRELEADASATRQVYENVLAKAKEVANLEQFTAPIARIISPAVPPKDPSWPKKKLILILSAILGVMIGIATVAIYEAVKILRILFNGTAGSLGATNAGLASPPGTQPSQPPSQRASQGPGRNTLQRTWGKRRSQQGILGVLPAFRGVVASALAIDEFSNSCKAVSYALLKADSNGGPSPKDRRFAAAASDLVAALVSGLGQTGGSIVAFHSKEETAPVSFCVFTLAATAAIQGSSVLLVDAAVRNRPLTHAFDGNDKDKPSALNQLSEAGLDFEFISLVDRAPKYAQNAITERQLNKLAHLADHYDLVLVNCGSDLEPGTGTAVDGMIEESISIRHEPETGDTIFVVSEQYDPASV